MKNTKFTEHDVISIKLTTKEEVVGKFIETKDDIWIISKPFILTANQNGLGFVPFIITASELVNEIEMNSNNFVGVAYTETEIKNAYIQNTTGLTLI